jgi:predicted nucleic acid-binding protein
MRVYAESNFVLELVLEQEQGIACEQIVSLAESRTIELALPAYALIEPYQTIIRRENDRETLSKAIRLERAQLQRTASLAPDTARLQDAEDLLLRASQDAFARFSAVRARLLRGAEILAVDASILETAEVDASRFSLSFPDAVMVAAVYHDAAKRHTPSVFLNRNIKDFLDPDVKKYLASVSCTVIGSFDNGLARINSALAAP